MNLPIVISASIAILLSIVFFPLPSSNYWLQWRASLIPSTKLGADLIVKNGVIFTSDPSFPFADSMAIRDGRILRIGSYSSLQVWLTSMDGHMGLANSVAPKLAGVTNLSKDPNGGTIMRTANEGNFRLTGAPICVCSLIVYAMSSYEFLDTDMVIDPPNRLKDLEKRKKMNIQPTGLLIDDATELILSWIPEVSGDERREAMLRASSFALIRGVTAVVDFGRYFPGAPVEHSWQDFSDVYQWADSSGKMKIRVCLFFPMQTWSRAGRALSNWIYFGGVKAFADSSLGSNSALFHELYFDDPHNFGLQVVESESLLNMTMASDMSGLQVAIHAIGDRANDLILDMYESVVSKNGKRDRRFRIEHALHLTPGTAAAFGPGHSGCIYFNAFPGFIMTGTRFQLLEHAFSRTKWDLYRTENSLISSYCQPIRGTTLLPKDLHRFIESRHYLRRLTSVSSAVVDPFRALLLLPPISTSPCKMPLNLLESIPLTLEYSSSSSFSTVKRKLLFAFRNVVGEIFIQTRRYLRRLTAVSSADFDFALQDALESSGIDTSHARVLLLLLFYCKEETIEATKGFVSQIKELSNMERETSISINRGVDLWKTALYIAAEDDSLVSHSSVPLPVDAFLERLDDLSMGYCFHYNLSCSAYQLASAKAAQHRLEWDAWTREMRDYSILLYHCGLYDQSLKYLKLYQDAKSSSPQRRSTNSISILEEEAVQKLLIHALVVHPAIITFITTVPSHPRQFPVTLSIPSTDMVFFFEKGHILAHDFSCNEVGSLSTGKFADFVVLSTDSWDDFATEVSASVNATYVGGVQAYP
ncbi:Amidohydrolase family, ISF2 isoform 2 [Hibiscus syriacus]|uniref:Amidohydrolase family, ISF2 isoform 2 n=1 Tax=Hibiscus syriacus TaxID=106335 RepID=A0A6A3C5J7_HIBSY|nr:Amidohydrolase family, ISF2 isoform 2 [Hibiscus syriacus]